LLDISIGGLKGGDGGQRDRFYRWLDVSDSSLSQPEKALNVYYSEVIGSRKSNLPIVFEGLIPSTKWIFSLAASQEFHFKLPEMLGIVDGFYRAVWEKTGIKEAPPENGYLLRLGQGSSAWATSLLLFAEAAGLKYSLKPPRTRKLVDARTPMGWVLLTVIAGKDLAGWEMPEPSTSRVDTGQYRVEIKGAASAVEKPGKTSTQVVPQPQKRRPAPELSDFRATFSAKTLLGLITKLIPSDKIGLERILDGLEGLEKKQAVELAVALREKLRSFGQWEKHPKRFEIECLIQGDAY
jgi:hypothetical protein